MPLSLPSVLRRPLGAVTVAALALSGIALATPASAATGPVVINEIYGGGGNTGATLTNDFVELRNTSGAAVDVTGWSVQYHSSTATGAWQSTPLSGSIPANGTFLVAEARGTGGTVALPAPDAAGTISMAAGSGTVAVVGTSAALTCADSTTCAAAARDLVGYGATAIGAVAPAASSTQSVALTSTGFVAGSPSPTNSKGETSGGTTTPPTPPTEGDIRIHDIQGTGWLSPKVGAPVAGVPGVVTGVRSTGYFLQDPHPDADSATSEGVFVFTGSAPAVAVGDSVLVTGSVSEFYAGGNGATNAAISVLSVTEISARAAGSTYVVAHGSALPDPIRLTPTTVPDVYAPDLGGANLEATAVQRTRSALDYYESIEGMRVEVDDARVVGPSNQYGEQYVTTKPAQDRSYRGGAVLPADNAIPSGRLEVVPLDGSNPGVRVGDVLRGATVGPLDYSQFGGYTLAATQLGRIDRNGLAPTVVSAQRADQLSIATYNVENLTPTDSAEKYGRLAAGVVINLASPDVVTVEEVQDNTGAKDDGTVAADQTLTKLTQAIAAAGGPFYQWREIDPRDKADGGEPGGNIRIAFLYNPARVSFVDRGASDVDRTVTGTAITGGRTPELTLSPGRIDPGSDAWTDSRKPLAGEFRFRGETVFVIGNHFNSKGGDQSADGRYQYPAQTSRVQRLKQATEVHDFVAAILAKDRRAKVVVAGDLNDYQFSPPLKTLTGEASGHRILTDLITTLPKDEQYTYVYNGVSQVLDHILVSNGVGRPEYRVVHVNAEYENQVSDHDPQLVRVSVPRERPTLPVCQPSALALGYSDGLDKLQRNGVTLGGLSSLAYDRRTASWASTVDNHGTDPARIWFFRSLSHPTVTRDPLVLKRTDGTPYDGTTADDEGLAILPDGDFVVSSETEPSIRIFGRDGVQIGSLPVPARFAVTGTTPDGQATANATLEGLTVSRSGRTIVAAMEGALSGDVSATGDATEHRFLVYTQDRRGSWTLAKQIGYRADPGLRVAEVAAYGDDSLLVEEAAYAPATGNTVRLQAATGLSKAADVTSIANLSGASASVFRPKTLVADLVTCPTLGAAAKQFQANPLLDNYEGMAITGGAFGGYGVSLISDDNFGATQVTRILNLAAKLP